LRPQFYIPLAAVALLIGSFAIYMSILASGLKAEAAVFDMSHLEQMESASVIVDRNDKIFGQIYVENRETIPYDQIPRNLVNAVVAVEDAKFYQHRGYVLSGILRAALKNFAAGHVRQGASTITQQLARNSFALKERTFRRKLLEIYLAKRIEENFDKQKIMELYLNRIYFGGGLYGAEAASRGYFAKPAREMTLAECATLAGLIKSPNRLSPWNDKAGAKEARNYALERMRSLGLIDRSTCANAQAEEVVISNRQNAQGQTYAVDYIRQKVIEAVGWDRAMNEGYRIRTTIDADLQRVAEDSLRKSLDKAERVNGYGHQTYADYAATFKKAKSENKMSILPAPEYLQGAIIALDNATGGILVLVGGRDFEHNQYDRALQARRPAGTAMKPFVYAAAFESGDAYPGTVVEDSPLDNRAVMIGGTTGILGEWGPESEDNRFEGAMTARQALAKSKNGATVRLGLDVGVDGVLQLCKTAGIRSPLRPYPATFLGASELTLAELALGYTIFPSGGARPSEWHILERIEEKDGTVVWDSKKQSGKTNVVRPDTAYEVHSCLVDALEIGTGKLAHSALGLKKIPDIAGKTGTAYDFTDALFAGYDSAITCAVWAGFDKPQKIYRGAFGRELAMPVWIDIMNASSDRYVAKPIPQPATLKKFEICTRSGLLATDKCYDSIKTATGDGVQKRTTYMELASDKQKPTEACNVHGGSQTRLARDESNESEFPRAAAAVELKELQPVALRAPTLLAEKDPYNSAKATLKPSPPEKESAEEKIDNGKIDNDRVDAHLPEPNAPIMKAIPVQPNELHEPAATPAEIRKAQPVGPLDEAREENLLRKATPPPQDEDEQ
jgi:penicillin-binding protein 1A